MKNSKEVFEKDMEFLIKVNHELNKTFSLNEEKGILK